MARETKLKEDTAARLQKISRVIQSIASGDFSSRLELAPALDEIDSIACGINMLAEELGERFEEKAYIDRRVDAVLEALQKAAAGDLAASADLEEKNDAFDALTAGTNMMIEEVGARIREIEQAKDYLDNIIRSMIDILFVVDAQAKITTVNAATCDVSGYTEEELIGQSVSIIFAEEEEEEEEEAFFKGTGLSRLMRDGEVRNMELTILCKSAERIPLVFNGSAIREEDGSLAAVVGVARDMRETMRLIADLRESEERYRYLFENVFDVIFSIDRQLRILNISPSVERTLGYKPEELIGRSFPDLNILSPESLETAVSDTMRVFDGERIALTVYEFIAKDGTRRFGELSVTPLSRDGEVVSAISVARDITDKKLAEEALKRSHDELEMRVEERTEEIAKINEELRAEITERKRLEAQVIQSAKMASLGMMAGGIAHEIRNPLGICSMAAELLVKNPEDRVLREGCTDRIYSNVHRASRIIENLIKFARPSSDDRRPIDLNETLEATLSLRENQIALQQIELSREFVEDMPPVLGSSSLLQQVFLNIILNAANAMPGGGKLTISTLVNPEGKAEVRFADTGCGIPQEHLDNIFDPFFTTMPAGKGTGLGLSVSYGIIQQHGGSIEVESVVGAGTTFKVILKIENWKVETLAQTWHLRICC